MIISLDNSKDKDIDKLVKKLALMIFKKYYKYEYTTINDEVIFDVKEKNKKNITHEKLPNFKPNKVKIYKGGLPEYE